MSSHYGKSWDHYVTDVFGKMKREDSVFPGDEWGTPGWWKFVYDRLMEPSGARTWKKIVEVGPGSGKYTLMMLEKGDGAVLAFDVSAEFLKILHTRGSNYLDNGRLATALLDGNRADEMLSQIEKCTWRGSVDAFVSIDAMVHVDIQYLVSYLLTAAIVLRENGKLILTLADATSPAGLKKLLSDVKLYYPKQGLPSLKFEFVSPEIVRCILGALGFTIDLMDYGGYNEANGRDLYIVATKAREIRELESYLR